MLVMLTGDSKLAAGVNVSLVIHLSPVQGAILRYPPASL